MQDYYHKDIRIIQEFLGQDYGKIPAIIPYTWTKRFLRYWKKHLIWTPLSLIGAMLFASKGQQLGEYDPATHTIFYPVTPQLESENSFAFRHELGHGYVHQRKNDLRYVQKRIEYAIMHAFTQDLPANFESDFIMICVDEGIADYLAIESEKLELERGKPIDQAYCFRREWELVAFDCAKEGQKFHSSTPLDLDMAKTLGALGTEYINYIKDIRQVTLSEATQRISNVMQNTPRYAYVLGHYLVRSACLVPNTIPGRSIDVLISTPPTSLKELQTMVIDNIS